MENEDLTIVNDCGNWSNSINVTLVDIAELTITFITEAFSIFHDENEDVLKPWIDFTELEIDKVANSQGVLNSSGLIQGVFK